MTISALGQKCTHADLSRQFMFQTKISRLKQADSTPDSCVVTISTIEKLTKKTVQTITYTSNYFFSDVFQQCNSVRSYSTGKNKNGDVLDNNYGDFVVADFNFDGKDDFAATSDSGGNGGPSYNFCIQNRNGRFILDNYLTDTMIYFPDKFNKSNKTLTTLVHANSRQMSKTIYQLDSKTNKWRKISRQFLP